jgi:hypothetical protein
LIYNLVIGLFLLISISCNKKHKIPQSLVELNKIIPVLKDSAYYYSYYKDFYNTKDTIDHEELGYIKVCIDKSKFIYHNNKKYLIINPRTIGEEVIRIYGYKKNRVKNITAIKTDFPTNTNYECKWNTNNSYIIVQGNYHNGLSSLSEFFSYNYIYGFKNNNVIIMDSITTKHRVNNFKYTGTETIAVNSTATVVNWKFISKNCILKEYESGEVFTEPRTDSIIFKPNSKKHSEKKCF